MKTNPIKQKNESREVLKTHLNPPKIKIFNKPICIHRKTSRTQMKIFFLLETSRRRSTLRIPTLLAASIISNGSVAPRASVSLITSSYFSIGPNSSSSLSLPSSSPPPPPLPHRPRFLLMGRLGKLDKPLG